jgi:hypothetical protein
MYSPDMVALPSVPPREISARSITPITPSSQYPISVHDTNEMLSNIDQNSNQNNQPTATANDSPPVYNTLSNKENDLPPVYDNFVTAKYKMTKNESHNEYEYAFLRVTFK